MPAAPPTRPQLRERYEQRRAGVVAAAAGVFARRGFHGASIDDLSLATGLTRGGLYHYTAGKQELLFAVLEDLMEPLLEQTRAVLAEPASAEAHLRALTRGWLAHIATHRDHMRVFNQERATLQRDRHWEGVRGARREFEALLAGLLARGQSEGALRMADPALTLLALLGMVNHTAQWLAPDGRLSAEQIADGYCDLLLEGIRT